MRHRPDARTMRAAPGYCDSCGAPQGMMYEDPEPADGNRPPPAPEPDGEPAAGPAPRDAGEPDDSPGGAGGDGEPSEPPAWTTQDGDTLVLPVPVWRRWGGAYRPPVPGRPSRSSPARPPRPRPRRGVDRLGRLASGARRIGTLRSRRTGTRYPVYRGSIGGRGYRIVARSRAGLRRENEIVLVRPAPSGPIAGEREVFPLGSTSRSRATPDGPVLTTRDGYRLRLPHARVHLILARLEPAQLRRLVGSALERDPAPALAAALRRLARGARRVGSFRGRRIGRLPVFSAAGYRLVVRPISASEGELLTLRAEPEREVFPPGHPSARRRWQGREYRVRGAQVRIQWEGPYDPSALRRPGGGVYIVEREGKPIYLGETDRFARRWHARHQMLRNLGVYDLPDVKRAPYRVWLGKLTTLTTGAVPPNALREDVEHVLVRYLGSRGVRLTNLRPSGRLLAAPAGIRIENIGGPSYLPPVFHYRRPEPLEV